MDTILVIGSMNVDMTVRVKELPKAGETIMARDMACGLGGKGANQAYAAARLGGKVKMLGCVGNDDFGRKQLQALQEAGIDIADIKVDQGTSTGSAIICVEENGSNCIVVNQGANGSCDESYLKEQKEAILACDIILAQMEIPQEALYLAVQYAERANKRIILNPAPAPERIPDDIYPKLDYLTPNETELMKLAGMEEVLPDGERYEGTLREGARRLLDKGVKTLIVTLGDKGCGIFKKGYTAFYPAMRVKAVDTTAAGDCFNGAFAAALSQGKTESEAIHYAVCASAIAVTRDGAQQSLPFRDEVETASGILLRKRLRGGGNCG